MKKAHSRSKTPVAKKKRNRVVKKHSMKDIYKTLVTKDFRVFLQQCFQEIYPGKQFLDNWHIDAITWQLRLAMEGKRSRLIINLPPRYLKSFILSVVFPAWILAQDPTKKVITISYSDDLAKRFMREFRKIVKSEWYGKLFPKTKIANKDTESETVMTAGGYRYVTSIGGTLTGQGGDFIIIDDPLKAEEALSDAKRIGVNEWYDTSLFSRLENKKDSVCIVVMQRLHENDLTGHLIDKGSFHVLSFPAIAEEDQQIPVGENKNYLRRAGDILHPEHEDRESLQETRRTIGSMNFASQYLQSPVPAEGNLFKREWIRHYNHLPDDADGLLVWSWDPASSQRESADFSVGTYWYMTGEKRYLISVVRVRHEFMQLKDLIDRCASAQRADVILIENKGVGEALIPILKERHPNIIGIDPKGSKETRAMQHAVAFELGHIYFPRDLELLGLLMNELMGFPNVRYDDIVDSITQALGWAYGRNFAAVKRSLQGGRPRRPTPYPWRGRRNTQYIGGLDDLRSSFEPGIF